MEAELCVLCEEFLLSMVLMCLFCSVSCFLSTVSVQGVVEHRSAGVCQGVLHTDGDRCAVELCSHTASAQQDSSHNPLRETHVLSCLSRPLARV